GAELSRSHAGGKLPRRMTFAGGGEYTPTIIRLKGFTASGEGVTVGADGTIDQRSGRVDAGVRIDASGGSSVVARPGGPAGLRAAGLPATGRIAGALTRPQLSLHAVATGVSYERRTLERLEADLSLRGGTLVVSDLSGDGLGATIGGSAELGLFDGDL